MATLSETSDQALLELLRRRGPMTIAELTSAMEVTANAVRQRLARLMEQGLISRSVARTDNPPGEDIKPARGRPNHTYSLTDKARRQAGDNFADLAVILWREIRLVKDPAVRRGLLKRVADAMAARYQGLIAGANVPERMQSLATLFAERRVPLSVTAAASGGTGSDNRALPVLVVEDCPYPQLAEEDRGICAVEKMMFSQLLSEDVRLTQCRLDGHACCQFETS
jgi:predicted ArsR family transcriptional regulator